MRHFKVIFVLFFLLLNLATLPVRLAPVTSIQEKDEFMNMWFDLSITFPFKPREYTYVIVPLSGSLFISPITINTETFRVVFMLITLKTLDGATLGQFVFNDINFDNSMRYNHSFAFEGSLYIYEQMKNQFQLSIDITVLFFNLGTHIYRFNPQSLFDLYYEFKYGSIILDIVLIFSLIFGTVALLYFIIDRIKVHQLINYNKR
jgi:hypothetical protein